GERMMQNVKDSFYIALRDRLAIRNPDRKVVVGGEERPAIVVAENEFVAAGSSLLEVFHLKWSKTSVVTGDEPAPMLQIQCEISYCTEGSDDLNAQDRGRVLAAMDAELLDICRPGRTEIEDFTQLPPFSAGTTLFWSLPQLGEIEDAGPRLSRTAAVEMYAIAERGI
ncbi:MAG TPA: hypothetical protein VMZ25_05670, partial [Terriglobales bacterium]|nr:hypothetical protein [Terriglobales bacterium]